MKIVERRKGVGRAREILHAMQRVVDPLLDFIYPPLCRGCGIPIHHRDVLCPSCMMDLPELVWDDRHDAMILDHLRVPLQVEGMRVGYQYEGEGALQACIHAMKYREMHSIAFWFGRLLGERLAGSVFVEGNPCLIPVPLHRMKLYERGFNQSEWLARGVAYETDLRLALGALSRTRYTKSQAAAKLHQEERKRNVDGAFRVERAAVPMLRDAPVILVDDLITTGATTGECTRALRGVGVTDLRVLALAAPVHRDTAAFLFNEKGA